MSASVFDSSDLHRIEAYFSEAYAPMQIGSPTASPHAHVDRVSGSDSVTVDHLDLGFEMLYDVDPLGKICLCSIASGSVEDHLVDGARHTTSFGPGDVFSFSPPDRRYRGRINRARYSITMFDPALLDQVAVGGAVGPLPDGDPVEPIRLLDHRPLTAARAQTLHRTIEQVADVLADPRAQEHPLVTGQAAQHLARTVLRTFPTTRDLGPSDADRHEAASSRALRLALEHLQEHVADPVTVPDLARAAGVTPRALQLAFAKHLETTPTAYLRRVRLAHARRDLLTAGTPHAPCEGIHPASVTDVAMRWGFYHQGRFAAAYRSVYGETPVETLRRSLA